ncbi:response regulator [Anatilimnocola floriformis]|uniref:response regulator n=1 Tax=Anatilimnocola floriformis TaxID=2948575 RepID=UPI0020C524F6|nr:response regulator [Anatilimnocola floriformis]
MTKILVVDDSAVDRRLIGGLLQRNSAHEIAFAEDVGAALLALREQIPDLIVTDLHMPQRSGLELVAAVRLDYPGVPVILVTGQGRESLAAEALHHGAAGYVPKSLLAERLLDAVNETLSLTRGDKTYERLITCLRRCEFRFKLENDLALIDPLVDLVQQMVSGMALTDPTGRFRIGAAIREGLQNAVIRGNLELTTAEIPDSRAVRSDGELAAKVTARAQQSPYSSRGVDVEVIVLAEHVEIVIRDEGPGFAWQAPLAAARETATLGQSSKRGHVLMQAFMDEVTYNSAGNELRMVKRADALR